MSIFDRPEYIFYAWVFKGKFAHRIILANKWNYARGLLDLFNANFNKNILVFIKQLT